MSVIYFDGVNVHYDSIVAYESQESECEKVVKLCDPKTNRTLTVCTVGHWGLGRLCTDFIEENFEKFKRNKKSVLADVELRSISEKKKESFECFIVDSHSPHIWMFDDGMGVWGKVPRQSFIIGHPRAVAVTAIMAAKGVKAVKKAWKDLEESHYYYDRVTREPYLTLKAIHTEA